MSINDEPRRMMVLPLGSCSFVPFTVRRGSPPLPPASAPPAPEAPPVPVDPPAPAAADPPPPSAVPALLDEHADEAKAPTARIQSRAFNLVVVCDLGQVVGRIAPSIFTCSRAVMTIPPR